MHLGSETITIQSRTTCADAPSAGHIRFRTCYPVSVSSLLAVGYVQCPSTPDLQETVYLKRCYLGCLRISQGLPDAAASQSDWAQLIQTVIRYSAQWFRHGVLFLYACEDQVMLRYLSHETGQSQTLTIRCHSMAHLRLLYWLSWLVLLLPSSALLRRRSAVLLAAEAARRLGLGSRKGAGPTPGLMKPRLWHSQHGFQFRCPCQCGHTCSH